jgi:hypothetical protein
MRDEMKQVKTLSNSTGPGEGQGIPDAVANQSLDRGLFSSAVKQAEEHQSPAPQHHEVNVFSTMVG